MYLYLYNVVYQNLLLMYQVLQYAQDCEDTVTAVLRYKCVFFHLQCGTEIAQNSYVKLLLVLVPAIYRRLTIDIKIQVWHTCTAILLPVLVLVLIFPYYHGNTTEVVLKIP
jgi:uncharacterized membrane protein